MSIDHGFSHGSPGVLIPFCRPSMEKNVKFRWDFNRLLTIEIWTYDSGQKCDFFDGWLMISSGITLALIYWGLSLSVSGMFKLPTNIKA